MHSMVYTIHIFGTTVCTRNESSNRESSIKPSRKQMSEISFAVWCTRGYAVLKKIKKIAKKEERSCSVLAFDDSSNKFVRVITYKREESIKPTIPFIITSTYCR